ncbi:demethylmenaquinone methyltransferase [Acrasis kona]|uniref:Demethylmenaquinone methyltransferase n=1 Tax=Acrasis kona TaxID=1008807 RepID=A0AAW2ZK40_9EUKA
MSHPNLSDDTFTNLAKKYNKHTGGATREVGRFTVSIAPTLSTSSVVLDNACGTGIIAEEVMKICQGATVHAVDFSEGMVEVAKGVVSENNWSSVTVQKMDGHNLAFEDNTFTHSISNFGLFLFPDSVKGLQEAKRTLKPDGWIAVTSWFVVGWYPVAQTSLKRAKDIHFEMPPLFSNWNTKEAASQQLLKAGFRNVQSEECKAYLRFQTIDEHVESISTFLPNMVPALKSWSTEEQSAFKVVLKEELEKAVARDENNNYTLPMFAYVTHGVK